MQKYKIIVAYDGTDFQGWQIQPSVITVVSHLQKTFKEIFGHEISIVGASRTDAGVHALGQVALCRTRLELDPDRMATAWNNGLPKSILIRSAQIANPQFHIFADVLEKTYFYHLFYRRPLPFLARYGWFYRFIDSVDMKKFLEAMNRFVGRHDFRSFCKNEPDQSTVRTINSINVCSFERFGVVRVTVKGKGFLRYQIRRMIGAALDVARKESLSIDFLIEQLKNPSDQQEFTRAAGHGLCLRKIIYCLHHKASPS